VLDTIFSHPVFLRNFSAITGISIAKQMLEVTAVIGSSDFEQ